MEEAFDARRMLYELVSQRPGTHFRELQRLSGMSVGVVKHHLDYLSRHGVVKTEQDARNLRYFPISFGSAQSMVMRFLRKPSARAVLLVVVEQKTSSFDVIVQQTGLSASTVSEQLKELVQAGIVKRSKHTYSVSDPTTIVQLLLTYRESFVDALVSRVIDTWQF